MAGIALDSSANLGATAGSALTASYTNAGNLLVAVIDENQTAGGVKVTGVTYGGSSMTEHPSSPVAVAGRYYHMFWMVGPKTGANNLVVSVNAGGDFVEAFVSSYTGVNQTGQPDANASGGVTATTSESQSITTVADNCWIVGAFRCSGSSFVAGSNTTIRQGTSNGISLIDSNSPQTPAGSKSLNMSWTNSSDAHIFLLSFSPAPASTTGASFLLNFI